MSLMNRNIIAAKTDADIIAAVNAKSGITVANFELADNNTVTLSDEFGNLDDVTLGGSPIWTGSGFATHDAVTAALPAALVELVGGGTGSMNATWESQFNTADIASAGNLFMSFWIKSDVIDPTGNEAFFSLGSTVGTDKSWLINQTTSVLRIRMDNSVTILDAQIANGSLTDDTWHLVCIDIDMSTPLVSIYLDGNTTAVDTIAAGDGLDSTYLVDPSANAQSGRGLGFFCNATGGVLGTPLGVTTRTIEIAQFLSIKATRSISSNIATLVSQIYAKGRKGLPAVLADL